MNVIGLKGSKYTLDIYNELLATFTGAQLASGIDLAMLKNLMSEQAENVHEVIEKLTSVHASRWHSIEVGLADSKTDALKYSIPSMLRGLDEEEMSLLAQAHSLAQPVPHRYELAVSDLPLLPRLF